MKSYISYIPPGKNGTLEELVHLDKDENLLYLESLHVTHVSLGENFKAGEKVQVQLRTPDGTFTFGTLQEGRIEQFTSDIFLDQDVQFTHTGSGQILLAGYKARVDPEEMLEDEEAEQQWKSNLNDVSAEEDDDEEDEEDEEDESEDEGVLTKEKGKKPTNINDLLKLQGDDLDQDDDEDEDDDDDDEDMEEMEDEDDEDEEEEEEEDEDSEEAPPLTKENGKKKHSLEKQTPPAKAKKQKTETVSQQTVTTPLTQGKGDVTQDKLKFESDIENYIKQNGTSGLSAIGSKVKKPTTVTQKLKQFIASNPKFNIDAQGNVSLK